ncbi:TonB-dependent receptor domain-containing protein [uncultured Paludibaculum sp.]|uniref:TonB-dependent receptor n=1 Tax=uncultured Paludibaculum sp. TaxID=1765020 RepID=UPI002AAB950B|nr:TonB-dependent receptor [uncultured Paludibaculum sp.]
MKLQLRLGFVHLVLALALFGQADANKAQLFGTVLDPKGAAVPGASIRIKNIATGLQRELSSGVDGQYRAVQLDPGTYEVVAQSAGFAQTTLTGVTLGVGSTVDVNINLQVQATTQTIEVADTMINVALPAPSANIGATAIRDLPINGRRFQDFATLTPTVQVDPSRGQLSFAGQRGVNGNIMVDGADYNQPFFGGIRGGERSNFNFTIPQSAVQEFQAVSSGYAAEYGRSTGGVLNVISKSGSNDFHGDAFYQNRNRALSADNPIFKRQPSESLQQVGGSAGGRVIRDKLFFFGAVEHQRANTPASVLFTALDAITPTAATQEAFDYFRGLQEDFTRKNKATAVTAKGDYMFSKGHRLSLRYNHSRSDEPNSVTVGGALNPFTNSAVSNEGTELDRTHFGTVQYTHLFSPSVVNDTKFSQSYEIRPRLANSNSVGVGAGNIGSYGTRSFLPTTQDDYRTQITNSTTVLAGSHSLKFGIDFSKLSTVQTFGFNQFGSIGFSNSSDIAGILDIMGTGGTFANRFDNFNVRYVRQIGNLVADFGAKQMAMFAQDSWRVTSNLTVDLGLRWEGQWNPSVEANNTALVNRVTTTYPVGTKLDVTTIKNNLNQVMPRVGFAWTPFKTSRRTVVRGNAGLFYASTPLLLYSGPTNNFRTPPGDVSIQIGPFASGSTNSVYSLFKQVGVDFNTSTLGALPVIPLDKVQQAAALAAGGAAVDPLIGANVTAMSPDFRNPRSYQYGIGFETELASNWIAGVQYQQVNTMFLERNRDLNLPVPTLRVADGRPVFVRANRPVPSQGQVAVRESSARALYRSAVFSTQYRARKLTAGVFYTLSTNYSDDDNERDSGGAGAENVYNFKPEYNYSNLDARHQFTAHALYSLPWGIEVSGILRTRSGSPYSPVVGTDTNGDSNNSDRPYSAVGVPFLRNSFRNRAVVLTNDLRLLKSFHIGSERYRVQLSAELFNLFNCDNVVFAGQGNVYGAGINPTTGAAAPIDSRFMLLRNSAGDYNTATTSQLGNPFQAQFGVRFFF